MRSNTERALDAAIRVLGTGGARALTHRAVDAEAGLPTGSTSNYFRTRDSLLVGVISRIAELEREQWQGLITRFQPTTIDELADALIELVGILTGPERLLSVARYALFVEAATRPDLQTAVLASADIINEWARASLAAIGIADPMARMVVIFPFLEGIILRQVCYPRPGLDIRAPLLDLLRP